VDVVFVWTNADPSQTVVRSENQSLLNEDDFHEGSVGQF